MSDFLRELWRFINDPPPFASRRRWDEVRLGCLVVLLAMPIIFVLWLLGVVE